MPPYSVTITYVYDSLYRLTEADYSDGRYFRYTYDSVGNRLTEEKCVVTPCTTPITNTYTYDTANRLTSVNGQLYTWDDNGNLLNDGTGTYGYDAANRLTSVVGGGNTSTYSYNGLGDRVSQTVNSATTNYVLDMNAGLTQVLAQTTQPSNDPTTYLYGNGRIGELQPGGFAYHLGDALGSVRQLVDASGGVTLAKAYEPYGSPLTNAGTGSSVFAFAGEQVDVTGLSYNRARYYASGTGRFITKDTFPGDPRLPLSLHRYIYAHDNPVVLTDPSGRCVLGIDCIVVAGVVILITLVVSGCSQPPSATPTAAPTALPTPQSVSSYRLTSTDWVGKGLVWFNANDPWGKGNQQAVLLALDMIQRVTGKSPENVVSWILGTSGTRPLRIHVKSGVSRGGGYYAGNIDLWAANQDGTWLTAGGISVLLQEMGHGIDESVGKAKGYQSSFTNSGGYNSVGWTYNGQQWIYTGSLEYGNGKGPANNYIDSPAEDFANSFAAMVIDLNAKMGVTSIVDGSDLSSVITLSGDANVDGVVGHGELGPIDDTRRQIILEILGIYNSPWQ